VDLLAVFVNPAYQVRSGWKFAAFGTIWFVTVLAAQLISYLLYPGVFGIDHGDYRFLLFNGIVLFIPSALTLLIMVRLLDTAPLAGFGIALHEGWFRDVVVGHGVAAGMLGLTLAGSFILGHTRVVWTGSFSAIPAILLTVAALALSAFTEEFIFRGYPLQVLLKGLGPSGAIALISFFFGLIHWTNPGATGMSVLGTVLAGVALSVAYLKTRSIWFPYGIHLGWNLGLSVVLGFPMSGIRTEAFLTTIVDGSEAILGGNYGPEAGLLGCGIFVVVAVVIPRMPMLRVSPEVQSALVTHSDKFYTEGIWKN
jgi:membrane protease YdiL (CAAX protease family)